MVDLAPPANPAFLAVRVIPLLSPEECDRIVDAVVENGGWRPASVTGSGYDDGVDPDTRSTLSAPLPPSVAGPTLQTIGRAVAEANAETWRYDLTGFVPFEIPTVLRYEAAVADHFRSHIDAGPSHSTRKLSFSLQLTDGATYQGGDLLFGDRLAEGYRNQGSLVVFPSVSLHEVTPAFRGIRHTVVGWIHGPTLR